MSNEIWVNQTFKYFFFIKKPHRRLPCCHQPSILPSWRSRSALAPRLTSPIPSPRVPYSSELGSMTPTTRNKHPGMQNNATRIGMAIVMRIIGNSGEKSWWQSHPSIMATERSKGAPGGALCAPDPFPVPQIRTRGAHTCV